MPKKAYKILLCDDDKFLLEMYKKKFDKYQVEAEMCASAKEALSKLQAGAHYDVVVLDIIMPEMDGLELLREIKKGKLAEDSTIIMLTNESGNDSISEAKTLGVDGYIVKATSIPSEVVEEVIRIADSKL